MREAFHVTPTGNLARIREAGLEPRIGPRAAGLGEPEPAVYLFADRDTAEQAVTNWLGEAFEEDADLTLITLALPENVRLRPDLAMGGELVCMSPVPPAAIRSIEAI